MWGNRSLYLGAIRVTSYSLALLLFAGIGFAQNDPGVRGGTVDAGHPLNSVVSNQPAGILSYFNDAKAAFEEVDNVTPNGLGPRFNFNSCGGCHAQPGPGGTSPNANAFPNIGPNPQSQVVSQKIVDPSSNTIPSFISANGPVREVRFPFFFNPNGSPDFRSPNGGVEDLFTISGRPDGGSCSLSQPPFRLAQRTGNIAFRIPTPAFGAGLIENIDDATLLANQAASSGHLGIAGSFNHNGNDGTISRFGWKAQNKSLMMFAGEAYNVEQGVTNELFPQERPLPGEDSTTGLPANCRTNPTPEDVTHFQTDNLGTLSDLVKFSMYMRLLAPPTPSTTTPGGSASIANGRQVFNAIGCNLCHTPSLTTATSSITPDLSNATVDLFSDLEIHHMGRGLADNISQGGAGGDQFRTAPLWGLGQRVYFLHDGRTNNLVTAIDEHASRGSEANTVIFNYRSLSAAQKQDLLNFLRSL